MGENFNIDSNKLCLLNIENNTFDLNECELNDFEMGFKFITKNEEIDLNDLDYLKNETLFDIEKSLTDDKFSIPINEKIHPKEFTNFTNNNNNNYTSFTQEMVNKYKLHSQLNNNKNKNNEDSIFKQFNDKIIRDVNSQEKNFETNFKSQIINNVNNNFYLQTFVTQDNTKPFTLDKNPNKNNILLKKILRVEMSDKIRTNIEDMNKNKDSFNLTETFNFLNYTKKKAIFRIEKDYVKKFKNNSKIDIRLNKKLSKNEVRKLGINKKGIKLIRNRLSAQKSRLKKKYYIQNIEVELEKTKSELEHFKNLYNIQNSKSNIENMLIELQNKEIEFNNQNLDMCKLFNNLSTEKYIIKKEYNVMQENLIIEIFKIMVKSMTPVELVFYEQKFLKLENIKCIKSLDNFFENIIQLQIE